VSDGRADRAILHLGCGRQKIAVGPGERIVQVDLSADTRPDVVWNLGRFPTLSRVRIQRKKKLNLPPLPVDFRDKLCSRSTWSSAGAIPAFLMRELDSSEANRSGNLAVA